MIAIYSDSKTYGGVEVLVARFAKYLQKNGMSFILVEREGTKLANELDWVKKIDPQNLRQLANQFSHVFFPNVAKLRNKNIDWDALGSAVVLCWCVHPNEIFRSFFPFSGKFLNWFGYAAAKWIKMAFPKHLYSVMKLLQALISGRGLVLMDGATRRSLHYFYPDIDGECQCIPIPAIIDLAPKKISRAQAGLSIGYLGRMDDFKYSAIRPLIDAHLAPLAKKIDIHLHLVAEGSHKGELIRLCKKKSITVHDYGFLENTIAKKTIQSKTDFALCMGTSALDIACMAHPCVMIDPAIKQGSEPQHLFRFVHEIEDYTLGEYRDFPEYQAGLHTFEDILEIIACEDMLGDFGKNYVVEHHDQNKVFAALLGSINASQVHADQVAPLVRFVNSSFLTIRTFGLAH